MASDAPLAPSEVRTSPDSARFATLPLMLVNLDRLRQLMTDVELAALDLKNKRLALQAELDAVTKQDATPPPPRPDTAEPPSC